MASLAERVHQDTGHMLREGRGDNLEDDLADTAEGLEVAFAAKLPEPPPKNVVSATKVSNQRPI